MFLHDETFTGFARGCKMPGDKYRATEDETRAERAAKRAAQARWGDSAFAEVERKVNDGPIYPGVRIVGVVIPQGRLIHGVGETFAEAFADADSRAHKSILVNP